MIDSNGPLNTESERIIVRCSVEMDLVYGEHFFLDSDDKEKVMLEAKATFAGYLFELCAGSFDEVLEYIQTKIVDEVS